MRSPSPGCFTISASWRGRRKRINTEGTEAGAQSTQSRAEVPAPAPAIAGRFATSYALLLGSTVFLGAFLLFLIEPLFAKLILPRFGGAAAVWAACLAFFQCALLLGYLYADLTSRGLTAARQSQLHIALLLLSLLFLPIAPRFSESHRAGSDPASAILLLLSISIGLPFVLLSATSPLAQIWYARASALIEPHMAAHRQAALWSVLFAMFVLLCSAAAWLARRGSAPAAVTEPERSETAEAPTLREKLLWLGLSACSSMLLLSITNK